MSRGRLAPLLRSKAVPSSLALSSAQLSLSFHLTLATAQLAGATQQSHKRSTMATSLSDQSRRLVSHSIQAHPLRTLTLNSLWMSGQFADLTLVFNDNTALAVHKFVVCRCDFFRACCSGGFKVSRHGLRLPTKPDIRMIGSKRQHHLVP